MGKRTTREILTTEEIAFLYIYWNGYNLASVETEARTTLVLRISYAGGKFVTKVKAEEFEFYAAKYKMLGMQDLNVYGQWKREIENRLVGAVVVPLDTELRLSIGSGKITD